jgi:hypothetical protein
VANVIHWSDAMSYRLFYQEGAPTGTKEMKIQCISAIFGYQIQGPIGVKVRFSGTNRIDPDVDNPDHWLPIVEIEKETADDQELGHTTGHSYDTLMFEVLQGPADVMVSSGVAG